MILMNPAQEKWELRAAVRSRSRILLDKTQTGYFFPESHQPLTIHPRVVALGKDAINYLLVQSFYKYSNDIATIETNVVNQAILSVTRDILPISFESSQKIDMYTIMVDESYHAYIAYDTMLQIQEFTQIKPLALPKVIEIEVALSFIHQILSHEYHGIFNLLAVCLAENTLTKEIVSMLDKTETHPFFQKILKDHLADESRHSGIFFKILTHIWRHIDLRTKQALAPVLPLFLEKYLGVTIQIEFDKSVLIAMGLSEHEAVSVLNETYAGFKLTKSHHMLKNILFQLNRSGVMDDITSPYFRQKNWL